MWLNNNVIDGLFITDLYNRSLNLQRFSTNSFYLPIDKRREGWQDGAVAIIYILFLTNTMGAGYVKTNVSFNATYIYIIYTHDLCKLN